MSKPADLLNADDRFAIEDLLGRYFWALDTGDIEAALDTFCDAAVVRYDSGERYEGPDGLRRFVIRASGGESARGRMHINRPLFIERRGVEVFMRSYLIAAQSTLSQAAMTVVAMRYIEDTFIRTPAGWRIKERAIYRWNEQTAINNSLRQ